MSPVRMKALGLAAILVLVTSGCVGSSDNAAPAGQTVMVYLGLARDTAGLESAAIAVNDPASEQFGSFLTMAEVAERFGASDVDISRAIEALEAVGVSGTTHPSGGLIEAELTVAQAEDLLDISIQQGTDADGRTFVRPADDLVVPESSSPGVTEVVGISRTVELAASEASEPSSTTAAPAVTVDQDQCSAARAAVASLHDRYGISSLHESGATGGGASVAVLSLDLPDPTSIDLWSRCLELDVPEVRTTAADHDLDLAADAEIDLDLATLVGTLPEVEGLDVVVFDGYGWIGAPIATALEGEDLPAAISTSVGFCEAELSADAILLSEWLLAAAAAGGVTVVASAGDDGSSACSPASTEAAVQYPASSAFVTSVGGTQIAGDGSEVVWSDGNADRAGGGGTSEVVGIPKWQADAGIEGDGRAVPDLAALAAPQQWPPIPVCRDGDCEWLPVGGTSAATPLVTAGLLLTQQRLASAGKAAPRLWAPSFYTASNSVEVTDVTSGSNDLQGVGCCTAAAGFDAASGLGTPGFTP